MSLKKIVGFCFCLAAVAGVPSALWAQNMDMLPDMSVDDLLPPPTVYEPVPTMPEAWGAPAPLRLVHPAEGARLPFLKSSFVFGSADPQGKLSLNGQPVPIHPEGGFLAMIPYSTGTFSIRAELVLPNSTVIAVRTVSVAGPTLASPRSPLTVEYVRPDLDTTVRPGDVVSVICKGSPGMEAVFQVQGVHPRFPMMEDASAGVKGVYRGMFVVQPGDELNDNWIRVTLTDKERGRKIVHESPGRLSRLNDRVPWVVAVTTDNAVVRAVPALASGDKGGYLLFPPPGTRLQVLGRQGAELKVKLGSSRTGWISEGDVRRLPDGTPPPITLAGTVSVASDGARSTLVRLILKQKVPFLVEASPDKKQLDISFFGAASNTDWIHYASTGAVERIQWFQDDPETYRLRVHAPAGDWWGYDTRYEGTTFVLELRSPAPPAAHQPPLAGLRIAVDPGHSADRGSIGPTGLLEKDANWAIAQCLKKKLEAAGAEVVFIREGSQNVPLYDRPKLAWQARADLLVSVHNNALPEGGDPLEKNGYSVYYFQPHSFELAREIHRAYRDILGASSRPAALRDDGLHYGNLALARPPQMPAVLTESAYIIVPAEEALLKKEPFQCDCAEAMLRGIVRFVSSARGGPSPLPKNSRDKRSKSN
ncbi:MAG TPA: N-acetylmuramoyl-L-alanine amidase [Elusimicrobiota bacterium]|nr:N-acetylmuramoyl-L-alanine amidase [Elusimicrobiota bacterium]